MIAGNIIADATGIETNGQDSVFISQTGTIAATGSSNAIGIAIEGTDNSVEIAGSVVSDGIGLYITTNNNEIIITPTGLVRGGGAGFNQNSNLYSGAIMAFTEFGTITNTIVNYGTIIANVNFQTGQRVAIGDAGLGRMPPPLTDQYGLDTSDIHVMRVTNAGVIVGDVLLYAGEDLYNGRGGGLVDGVIDMGGDNDTLWGGSAADNALGGGGNDTMHGGGGQDTMLGGGGADLMSGGTGDDSVVGGSGFDTLNGNGGDDTLQGGTGDDLVRGGSGDDRLIGGSGNDTLHGQSGDDSLAGGTGDDSLTGGRDNDTLEGNAGLDTLLGGSGDDLLNGGSDADLLIGGAGNDTLIGGNSADIYDFDNAFGQDVIEDFSAWALEKIDLSDVAPITSFGDLTSNHATQSGADTIIDAGNGNTITLLSFDVTNLQASDFIF